MEPVIKCTLLVPLRYNDGRKIPKRMFDLIFADLFELAGGVTFAHMTKGAYRMADGSKKIDECQSVWVGVPKRDIADLRKLVARVGAVLGQESMYFEHGGRIEFVEPSPREEQDDESES